MNAIIDFFNSGWLFTLGYTLLHSLWQAAVVITFVTFILRFIPAKLSDARYAVASAGMLSILILAIGTFLYIYSSSSRFPSKPEQSVGDYPFTTLQPETLGITVEYLNASKSFIQSSIPFFLMIWLCGTVIFSLRILTGLMYVGKLREEAFIINNGWSQQIQVLARQLKIKRWIAIAESNYIQAPIVIGFLKPIILIPLGMFTSLSSEQLETIFLHELMHIRRRDYLINLIQSFLEAIFFFNPFVWIISAIMRREREHCCDDAVVLLHGNPVAYARALTTLEEVRLSKVGLSISLAENKNQLLNRIKRLMEKSVKTPTGSERMVPALLLVLGLICASWISTQTGRKELAFNHAKKENIPFDTTKKDKKNKQGTTEKAKGSKKITTINKDEKPDTEIAERSAENIVVIPPVPPPPIPDFNSMFDNFDVPSFDWKDEQKIEAFSKEFEENFRAKFGDFYETHGKDIEQMIEEAQQKVYSKLDENWELKMNDFAMQQQDRAKLHAENFKRHSDELSGQKELMQKLDEDKKRLEERRSLHMKEFEKNQAQFEKRMKLFEENTKQFQAELTRELIKDGYLDKDEKLKNIHWNNGSIEVNDKKIKSEDEKKYNELHKKFFKNPGELDNEN